MNTSTRAVVFVSLICVFVIAQTSAVRTAVSEENEARKLETFTTTRIDSSHQHLPSKESYVTTSHSYLHEVVNEENGTKCYDAKALVKPECNLKDHKSDKHACSDACAVEGEGYRYSDFHLVSTSGSNCRCSNDGDMQHSVYYTVCDSEAG